MRAQPANRFGNLRTQPGKGSDAGRGQSEAMRKYYDTLSVDKVLRSSLFKGLGFQCCGGVVVVVVVTGSPDTRPTAWGRTTSSSSVPARSIKNLQASVSNPDSMYLRRANTQTFKISTLDSKPQALHRMSTSEP